MNTPPGMKARSAPRPGKWRVLRTAVLIFVVALAMAVLAVLLWLLTNNPERRAEGRWNIPALREEPKRVEVSFRKRTVQTDQKSALENGALWKVLALASGAWWFASGPAAACTVCQSEAGSAVRGAIFDGSFAETLVAVVSPFPVVALLAIAVVKVLPR